MKKAKRGFTLISKEQYVDRFLQDNPSRSRRDVIARLDGTIAAHRAGRRCNCGEEIWIIGSAEVGYGCFTCITGESAPDSDYEIELFPSSAL